MGRVIFTLFAADFDDGVQSGCRVPGGQDEELVGGLIEEGGKAGHRVVPETQVVDQAAEQLRHDHDVVLQSGEPGDVEAGRRCVAGPHAEPAVAGLFSHSGQFVAQVREQRPVVGRVGKPLLDEVMVGRGSSTRPRRRRTTTHRPEADRRVRRRRCSARTDRPSGSE